MISLFHPETFGYKFSFPVLFLIRVKNVDYGSSVPYRFFFDYRSRGLNKDIGNIYLEFRDSFINTYNSFCLNFIFITL